MSRPIIHFVHANSYPAGTYRMFFEHLRITKKAGLDKKIPARAVFGKAPQLLAEPGRRLLPLRLQAVVRRLAAGSIARLCRTWHRAVFRGSNFAFYKGDRDRRLSHSAASLGQVGAALVPGAGRVHRRQGFGRMQAGRPCGDSAFGGKTFRHGCWWSSFSNGISPGGCRYGPRDDSVVDSL